MALAQLSGGYLSPRPTLGCGGCPALALALTAGVLTAGACGVRAARQAQGGWVAEGGPGRASGTPFRVAHLEKLLRRREMAVRSGWCGTWTCLLRPPAPLLAYAASCYPLRTWSS